MRPSHLTWKSFADALDDDFDTLRGLAAIQDWRAAGLLDLLAEGLVGLAIDRARASHRPGRTGPGEYAEADGSGAGNERLGSDVPGRRGRLSPHPRKRDEPEGRMTTRGAVLTASLYLA